MSDKEKIEALKSILTAALSELYEGADEEYSENLLDYLGTDEAELATLGITL